MQTEVFLALGANLGDPKTQIISAIEMLRKVLTNLRVAALYQSKPIGPADQPDYLNTAVTGWTRLSPEALLDQCQAIEHAHQRERNERWGPRTLDIDILFFGDQQIQNERLTIPHPELFNRAFVVVPLLDLIPSATTPTGDHIDRRRYDLSSLTRIH